MPNEQQQTSADNLYFDLVSIVYHSLEAAQTYATYLSDAQQSGNQQFVQLVQQMQQQNNQWAQQAKQLLAQQSSQSSSS